MSIFEKRILKIFREKFIKIFRCVLLMNKTNLTGTN